MGWSFWGGFLAVALILTVAGVLLRNRIRAFSRRIFGRPDLLGALEALEDPAQAAPRSLNGMDRLLLPQILRDFPDFDLHQAKEAAKAYLRENLTGKEEPQIHNVVLSQYFPALVEKTMVFQAAVSFSPEAVRSELRLPVARRRRRQLSKLRRRPGARAASMRLLRHLGRQPHGRSLVFHPDGRNVKGWPKPSLFYNFYIVDVPR